MLKFGKKPPGCFPHLRLIGADPPRPGFSGRCLTSFRSDHLDRTEASCARPPVRNSNSKNAVLRFFLGKHSQQITARSSPSRHARRVRPSCLGRVQTARADGPCTGTSWARGSATSVSERSKVTIVSLFRHVHTQLERGAHRMFTARVAQVAWHDACVGDDSCAAQQHQTLCVDGRLASRLAGAAAAAGRQAS